MTNQDHKAIFITGASSGLGRATCSEKIEPVYELDWGESLTISGIRIHCVPAMHFSARGILDRNKTLWCGYVIEFHA